MKKNPIGTIIVLIAYIFMILGMFLPIYRVDSDELNVHMTVSIFYSEEVSIVAVILMILGGLAILFALIGKKIPVLIFCILASVGMLILYFFHWVSQNTLEKVGAIVEKGFGNTFALIGAIVMLLAGGIYFITTKIEKKEKIAQAERDTDSEEEVEA